MKVLTQKENINTSFLCSFAYKFVCVDDEFTKPIVVSRGEMLLINLLKQILRSISIVKK